MKNDATSTILCGHFNRQVIIMPELAALLFDVDGTLADTEEIHRQCFNQAFADAGLDWNWTVENYAALLAVTGGRERIRHYLDTQRPDFRRPEDLDDWIARLHRAKTALYTTRFGAGDIPLRPGVRRLIEEARETGLRLGIATTTSPENVTALLEHSLHPDSPRWFDVIAAADKVPIKKPAPDVYLYALDRLGLTATQCLSFEDSENGVRASLAAGVPTLVTLNDYTRNHDFTGATVLLNHLGEPGNPCRALSGSINGAAYVDVALLRRLHARTACDH